MRKLEKRAILCMLLAACLFAGLVLYVFRFTTQGADWATWYYNRHIFHEGHLATGNVYDVNGNLLAGNHSGEVVYHDDEVIRRATAHAVGDADGAVATSAETAFRDRLVGYNILTGTYSVTGSGNDVTLTIDENVCLAAYNALAGRDGCVGVYNYETGEVICMVSNPSFDPQNPPAMDEAQPGTYMNKFLISTMTPGSIFKLVTSAAAIENYRKIDQWEYDCEGSAEINGEKIRCTRKHGHEDFDAALANSCNCGFADLTQKVGARNMKKYTKAAGLTTVYDMDGIENAAGSFEFPDYAPLSLAWAGIGQWKDQLNPCSMMVYVGAIARGGKGTVPSLIHREFPAASHTGRMIEESTAERLQEMMHNNVVETYGEGNFPGLDIYAKSGTAEVGDGEPTAWFTGFIKNEHYPYAFIVCVEEGGYGSVTAGPVANQVLQEIVATPSAATE